MPHGGRSSQQLFIEGVTDALILQHALSMEAVAETGGADVDRMLACVQSGKSWAECQAEGTGEDVAGEDVAGGDVTTIGTLVSTADIETQLSGSETIVVDEVTSQIAREYFDVQTPEKFLDDFFVSLGGFALSLTEAGMSPADIQTMIDPASGFGQAMFTEYMGKQAQIAAADPDSLYRTVGIGGDDDPRFLGQRPGDVTVTTFRRMTRTEAEEQLRRQGKTITTESIQQTIDDDFSTQQSQQTAITDEDIKTTEDRVSLATGTARFTQDIDVFARPKLDEVFQFSPSDFLQQRFGAEELDEAALGRIATEIRASAPRARPRGGIQTAVSARRA